MNAENIFFSYSRVDSEFTTQLAKKLIEAGINIWLDKFHIEAGEKWDNEIQKALESSNILLVILSKSSVKSENVMDEVSYAIGRGKKVIPVLIEECEVPFRIRRLQYANFTRSYQEGLTTLTEALDLDSSTRAKLLGSNVNHVQAERKKEGLSKFPKRKKLMAALISVLSLAILFWFLFFRPGENKENKFLGATGPKENVQSFPPIDFNVTEGTTLVYRSAMLARKDTFKISETETLENLMTAIINYYKISPPKDLLDEYASEKGGYRLKEALWKNNLPVDAYYSATLKQAGLKDFDVIEFKYELSNSMPMACPPTPVRIQIDGISDPQATLYLNGKHVSEFMEVKGQSSVFYFGSVMECNAESWYGELSSKSQTYYLVNPREPETASPDTIFLRFNLPGKSK